MKKKIISLFLSVVMVFTILPTYTAAFAADDAENTCNHIFTEETLPDKDSDFWVGHSETEYYVGSSAFISVRVPGTCTDDGWKIDKSWNEETHTGTGFCVVCGEIVTDDDTYVDATVEHTGHSFENDANDYVTKTAPTCTEDGIGECTNVYKEFSVEQKADGLYYAELKDHECTETFDIPATGHTWNDGVVTDPTCEDDGYTTYTCTVCGETEVNLNEGDAVPALNHDYVGTVTLEATCETKGEMTYVCNNDPAHTYVEAIPATNHNWKLISTTKPTCTEDGYEEYVCLNDASHTKTEYPDALKAVGHNWSEWEVQQEASCVHEGIYGTKIRTCNTCGEVEIEKIAPIIPELQNSEIIAEATCTQDGLEKGYCPLCGKTVYQTIPAFGHDYVETVTEPTCTDYGFTTYVCQNDSSHTYKGDFVSPKGHTEGEPVVKITPAQCEADGLEITTVNCSVCGKEVSRKEVIIPATGHDYIAVVTAPTCEEGGYTTYTCQNDPSHTYITDETDPIGHDWEVVNTVDSTCTEEGTITYVCKNDPSHTKEETIPLKAHEYKITETYYPTCTEDGYYVYTCVNCGTASYMETIPATGHQYDPDVYQHIDATCVSGNIDIYGSCINPIIDRTTGQPIDANGDGVIDEGDYCGYNQGPIEDDARDYSVEFELDSEYATLEELNVPEGAEEDAAYRITFKAYNENDFINYSQEDIITDMISHTGHDYEITYVKATCEYDGYWLLTCTRHCPTIDAEGNYDPNGNLDNNNEVLAENEIVKIINANTAIGHNWVLLDDNSDKEPTCTEDGTRHYMCLNDHSHTYTEKLPAHGHNFILDSYVAATCTEEGYNLYVCQYDDCNGTYKEYVTAKIPHNYVVTDSVAATCASEGYDVYTCTVCGDTYNKTTTPAKAHDYVVTGSVAATCTTEGYDIYTCSACGAAYNKTTTPATGHTFVATDFIDATCTDAGYTTYSCINAGCNESYNADFISAKGHNYVKEVVAPTCTEEGYTYFVCDTCDVVRKDANGDVYKTDITKPVDHVLNTVSTVAPTCGEDGEKISECINCDYVQHEVIPATANHQYSDTVQTPATCGKDGVMLHTCKVCDYSYTTVIPATGDHKYNEKVTKNPTCAEVGEMTYTCSVCGYSYTEELAKTDDHQYSDVVVTAATCGADGVMNHVCDICGESYTTVIPATGDHKYNEKVTKNPTCAEVGEMTYTCSVCGYSYTEELAKTDDHQYSDVVVTTATCGADGVMNHVCDICGESYTTVIPAKGDHRYDEKVTKNPTCAEVGEMTYTCSVCGYSYTEELAKTDDHAFSEVVAVPATCGVDGVMNHICEVCGYTYTSVIPALSHNYTYVEKAATCTANGEITATCTNCGDVQKYVVPATGHIYDTEGIYTAPTCVKDGYTTYTCVICHKDSITKVEGKALGHNYKAVVTSTAKVNSNGTITKTCINCGASSKTTIPAIKTITLSQTTYQYTGAAYKPKVTIKDSKGNTISSSNYTVTYSGNKNIGTAKVTIKFKGNYSGTVTKTFKIIPKNVGISVVSTSNNQIKFTWGKVANCTGYLIQYSTSSSFKSAKTIVVKSQKTCSTTIKKLKSGTKYYIRIRAYKTVSGKNYYGNWSTTSKICNKPNNVTIKSASTSKNKIKLTWNKVTNCTGYQIQYSTSSSFKSAKSVKVKGQKTTSTTIKNLKSNKKYYIRIRAYYTSNGKTVCGNWSTISKTCK